MVASDSQPTLGANFSADSNSHKTWVMVHTATFNCYSGEKVPWLHLSSNGIYSTRHCIYRTSSKHVTPWYSPLWLTLAKSSTPVSFLWKIKTVIWEQYCTGNTFLMTQVLSLIMETFCDQTVFLQLQISFTSSQILLVNPCFLKPPGFTVRHYYRQQTHKDTKPKWLNCQTKL